MLKHIVMWKLKDFAEGADRAANAAKMKSLLEAMSGKVPGLLKLEVGLATPGLEATCDVVLDCEFTDAAALAAYQNHPEHVAMKPFIGAIREARQVVDYQV
ncbi:MAG: Dabb family protein [Burkholderiaceae bacterium]